MLYHLLYPLHASYSVFNVFRYITFRTLVAALTALVVSFLLGPWFIRRLIARQIGQTIRPDGPQSHLSKAGTPTMGGTLILFSLILATLLLADLTNFYVWLVIGVTVAFAAIGFIDDYGKLRRGNAKGLSGRAKLLWQCAVAVGAAGVLYLKPDFSKELVFPFFKELHPNLGLWYVPFAAFVLVSTSNAVNLTDGLDGLAIGCTVIAAGALAVLTYVSGHATFASYLGLEHMPLAGELTIFCGAMVGASIGFLWYNAHPAEVFMGDVGSLALGGAIGTVAVIIKEELLLPFIGGVFVIEALSVILQVTSYKLRKKRIFKMAPIHHHFELMGWSESKIIVRFWIASLVFALFALTTLKLR